tara:strand:- start:10979 stop:12148 length:1170 start_codon:yes stop_codon:yes gene_type:complete
LKNSKNKKIRVLRLIGSLIPKFGGPQNAIISSSEELIKEGFQVDIITCDNEKFNLKKNKKINIINIKSFIGKNYRFSLKLFLWLLKNKKNYDFFLIHGLWQFNSLLARLLLKKYFIYTHGQLDEFFSFNFFKKIKKQIYWTLIEKSNLKNAKSILLTSFGEQKQLKKTYVNTNGIKKKIITYGIINRKYNKLKCIEKFNNKFAFFKNKSFYLFLGRFHEKKGCDIIINAINIIGNDFKSIVLLAGPHEDVEYIKYLKSIINKHGLKNKIILTGPIYNDLKFGAILSSKGMLLASHGENFGVSIVESLSMGKPVLLTSKVNIASHIIKAKAGLMSLNTIDSFSKKLMEFEKINKNDLRKMSKNALSCYKKNFSLSKSKKSLGEAIRNELD